MRDSAPPDMPTMSCIFQQSPPTAQSTQWSWPINLGDVGPSEILIKGNPDGLPESPNACRSIDYNRGGTAWVLTVQTARRKLGKLRRETLYPFARD